MSGVATISDEEFNRLQTQLLELRDVNYQLDDRCKRHERELQHLQEQNIQLAKDLDRSNKTLSKSKKAKEVEMLVLENESLQRKLGSQEDDFRLQNETIMKELAQLVSTNERLEAELDKLKACSGGVSNTAGSTYSQLNTAESSQQQDELRRLQAENSVLQNTLSDAERKHSEEVQTMRQCITELEAQCLRLLGKRGTPVGRAGNRDNDSVDGKDESSVENEEENFNNDMDEKLRSADGESIVISNLIGQSSSQSTSSIEQEKLINELKMSLSMEREEKRLLREELLTLESKQKSNISGVQEQADKVQEKLRKKQESYIQLQEEKEKLFKDLSDKLERVEIAKDGEIQRLQLAISSLQADLNLSNKSTDEKTAGYRSRVLELETLVAELERRVDTVTCESGAKLAEHLERSTGSVRELESRVEERNKQIEELKKQLQDCEQAHSSTTEQMLIIQSDRDSVQQALNESKKVADKRKTLLDELAIKYQEEVEQHRSERIQLQEKCNSLTEQLSGARNQSNDKTVEAERLSAELLQLRAQVQSLETAKSYLDRRLMEAEQTHELLKQEAGAELEKCKQSHADELNRLKLDQQQLIETFEKEKEEKRIEREKLLADTERLKQEIKDSVDERKLHEKKGATVLKDLKRQFQAERKRGDKLQEKLQEYLSDSRSRQSVEELFRSTEDRQRSGDGSSVCSWSPSGISRDNVLAQTPEEDQDYLIQKQENEDLMLRIAHIQQEKWTLEEKVLHLESSNSAMAEDLLQKTAVIDHYIMDGRHADHTSPTHANPSTQGGGGLSLKKMIDMVKSDDVQRDSNNKRLQRMLEETLTKNMHLQQDLEAMSKEIVRLSKNTLSQQHMSSPSTAVTKASVVTTTPFVSNETLSSSVTMETKSENTATNHSAE